VSKLDAIIVARQAGEASAKKHRQQLIKAVMAALKEGHTVTKVAQAAGVSRNTIYQWRKKAST
jgi:AcrR family transcriptional regulator